MLRRAMMAAGSGGGDPYWANVVSLLHFDGADGSTTFTDERGVAWTRTSGAEIDTAQSKFGGSSALFPIGVNSNFGRIDTGTDAAFAFGTGDFTIEGWLCLNASKSGFRIILDTRPAATNGAYPTLYVNGTTIVYYVSGSAKITSAGSVISLSGTQQHFAVSRASGSTRLFVEGVQVGSTYADSTNYVNQRFRYGNTSSSDTIDNLLGGWLDECRITKGVARYTANFTPPAAPFPTA